MISSSNSPAKRSPARGTCKASSRRPRSARTEPLLVLRDGKQLTLKATCRELPGRRGRRDGRPLGFRRRRDRALRQAGDRRGEPYSPGRRAVGNQGRPRRGHHRGPSRQHGGYGRTGRRHGDYPGRPAAGEIRGRPPQGGRRANRWRRGSCSWCNRRRGAGLSSSAPKRSSYVCHGCVSRAYFVPRLCQPCISCQGCVNRVRARTAGTALALCVPRPPEFAARESPFRLLPGANSGGLLFFTTEEGRRVFRDHATLRTRESLATRVQRPRAAVAKDGQ